MKLRLLITLTWSKIMAFTILGCAMFLDLHNGEGATAFMFSVPFVAGLIATKQYFDSKNGEAKETNIKT